MPPSSPVRPEPVALAGLPERYKGLCTSEDLAIELRVTIYRLHCQCPAKLIAAACLLDELENLPGSPVGSHDEGVSLVTETIPPSPVLLLQEVHGVVLPARAKLNQKVKKRRRQAQLPLVGLVKSR